MARDDLVAELTNLSTEMYNVDEARLLRPDIGNLSLEKRFTPRLNDIKGKLLIVVDFAADVSDSQLQNVLGPLANIKSAMDSQAGLEDETYASQRENFIANVESYYDSLMTHWTPFLSAKVESLSDREVVDQDAMREYDDDIKARRTELAQLISQVTELREQAANTLEASQDTAAKVSVKDAQEQFEHAQDEFNRKVRKWWWFSLCGLALFFSILAAFVFLKPSDSTNLVYEGAVRISVLASVGTVTAFCLKMFRAYTYMSEKNQHRQRIANSTRAFVGSAITSEQRDLILSQLVESVVQFGNSGLLHREDDNVYRPKMTIDSVMRTLSAKSSRE
ncbi:MAG: hypothetical protein OXG13_12055 [Gemmatimonadaceae bacterium]|nr:hypothetical protein [Gemmatimonadaceae bacterium]